MEKGKDEDTWNKRNDQSYSDSGDRKSALQ